LETNQPSNKKYPQAKDFFTKNCYSGTCFYSPIRKNGTEINFALLIKCEISFPVTDAQKERGHKGYMICSRNETKLCLYCQPVKAYPYNKRLFMILFFQICAAGIPMDELMP